jgi:hypothetical protein
VSLRSLSFARVHEERRPELPEATTKIVRVRRATAQARVNSRVCSRRR